MACLFILVFFGVSNARSDKKTLTKSIYSAKILVGALSYCKAAKIGLLGT